MSGNLVDWENRAVSKAAMTPDLRETTLQWETE